VTQTSTSAGNLTTTALNLSDVMLRQETEVDIKLQPQQQQQQQQQPHLNKAFNNLNQYIQSNDLEYKKKILSAESNSKKKNNSENETNVAKNSIDFAIDAVLAKCQDEMPSKLNNSTNLAMNSMYETSQMSNSKPVSNSAIQILPNLPQITVLNPSLAESQLIQIDPNSLVTASTSTINIKQTQSHSPNLKSPSKKKLNKIITTTTTTNTAANTNSTFSNQKGTENTNKKKRNSKKANGKIEPKEEQQNIEKEASLVVNSNASKSSKARTSYISSLIANQEKSTTSHEPNMSAQPSAQPAITNAKLAEKSKSKRSSHESGSKTGKRQKKANKSTGRLQSTPAPSFAHHHESDTQHPRVVPIQPKLNIKESQPNVNCLKQTIYPNARIQQSNSNWISSGQGLNE
jgi:hypothetical protein